MLTSFYSRPSSLDPHASPCAYPYSVNLNKRSSLARLTSSSAAPTMADKTEYLHWTILYGCVINGHGPYGNHMGTIGMTMGTMYGLAVSDTKHGSYLRRVIDEASWGVADTQGHSCEEGNWATTPSQRILNTYLLYIMHSFGDSEVGCWRGVCRRREAKTQLENKCI